jgi:hypothetical protein
VTLPATIAVAEIVPVPFRGGEVLTVLHEDKPHIILKPAFETIGLDADAQIRKIKQQVWARTAVTTVRGTDGRPRDMVTADMRTFLMALAAIPVARVAPEVRDNLAAYQSEVADVIEMYWTQGGVINPRATDDQLSTIIGYAEKQMRVLRLADGLVDRAWLEAKTRHTVARALGEEPEIDPSQRPLTTGEFLEEQGFTGQRLRSIGGKFGKRVKALYIERYGKAPENVERFVGGALRPVKGYTEEHRPLMVQALTEVAGVLM